METPRVIHLTVLGESLSSVCGTLSSLVFKKAECRCDNVLLFFLEPKKWNIFSAISLYFTKCSDWKTSYTHLK